MQTSTDYKQLCQYVPQLCLTLRQRNLSQQTGVGRIWPKCQQDRSGGVLECPIWLWSQTLKHRLSTAAVSPGHLRVSPHRTVTSPNYESQVKGEQLGVENRGRQWEGSGRWIIPHAEPGGRCRWGDRKLKRSSLCCSRARAEATCWPASEASGRFSAIRESVKTNTTKMRSRQQTRDQETELEPRMIETYAGCLIHGPTILVRRAIQF